MDSYLGQYLPLGVMILVGIGFVAVAQVVGSVLRPRNPQFSKGIPYESGVDPAPGPWTQIHIRYYVFAWLYVLFAVEAIFLFPWVFIFDLPEFAVRSAVEMGIFAGLLMFGLLYAWRRGALRWA